MKTRLFIITLFVCLALSAHGLHGALYPKGISRSFSCEDSLALDSLALDSLPLDALDSLKSDSPVAVSDSLQADSLVVLPDSVPAPEQKSSGSILDAPVIYTAKDSITYDVKTGYAHLFGEAQVNYQDLQLNADDIAMALDSSIVHASGRRDSIGNPIGEPVFQQGSDSYHSETMSYNFKTKKGFIQQVRTQQGDGYMLSQSSKRNNDGVLYVEHAKYTTCDEEHPHFYVALTRAKMRPGKDVVFGPAYLVVEDVPLPLAIPYGFFPFSKSYSSGFIMPTYGDESTRGFYLRDGGYYFAINDKIDLKLTGEIYTKGSWGINAQSNYRRRYKYSGNFMLSYLVAKEGEKNMPDYAVSKNFKLQWTHRQDTKANPKQNFSASVNFATANYERSNLTSMYNPVSYTQSTRTSSVNYSRIFSEIGLTLSGTFNLSQNLQDSTLSMTAPTLSITLNRFYPFKRKKMRGKEQWYEKIAMSYSGNLSNSLSSKEDQFFKKSLVKDWRNGMEHRIPINASFPVLKYITITPQVTIVDRMYAYKINQHWDQERYEAVRDTVFGLQNVYNWSASMQATTKLYGRYVPSRKIFGDKIVAIRHVLTPSMSFSYAPDFSAKRYGFYDTYVRTDQNGNVSTVSYSPYTGMLYGTAPSGKTGSLSMSLQNNLEMKVRSKTDSVKKISLIDQLGASMSYNFAAERRQWSDLNMNIRLKLTKSYTFSMNAVFATYAYEFNENGNVVVGDRTEYSYGRFGRFQGMSQNFSYTFSNTTFSKLFGGGGGSKKSDGIQGTTEESERRDQQGNTNLDPDLEASRNKASRTKDANVDEDGYLKFQLPWSFTVSYGVTMRENTSAQINTRNMRYPYKLTHTLNFSGNLRLAEGWNINFSSGYDFNYKKLSMTTASLSRDLHCASMSCSVVLAPYTSYNFTFAVNAPVLADVLKWKKQSSYSSNIQWY